MRVAEVIGDPIAHSKSPAIHGFWIAALGLEADYRAKRVRRDELADYLGARRGDPGWAGCNLTMPLKEAVVPLLDALDPLAERLGAVNTVVRGEDGRLLGYNTDVVGVAAPLRRMPIGGYPQHEATIVQIVGAGGAARAAVLGAQAAGYARFDIFNRSVARADALAALAGAPFGTGHPLDAIAPIRNPDDGASEQRFSHILINCTSLGMGGQNPVPVDLRPYFADTIVFDMVYAPLETPLLAQARSRGLRTIDGLQMLVAQAADAFHLLFGVQPPRARDAGLRALLVGDAG